MILPLTSCGPRAPCLRDGATLPPRLESRTSAVVRLHATCGGQPLPSVPGAGAPQLPRQAGARPLSSAPGAGAPQLPRRAGVRTLQSALGGGVLHLHMAIPTRGGPASARYRQGRTGVPRLHPAYANPRWAGARQLQSTHGNRVPRLLHYSSTHCPAGAAGAPATRIEPASQELGHDHAPAHPTGARRQALPRCRGCSCTPMDDLEWGQGVKVILSPSCGTHQPYIARIWLHFKLPTGGKEGT